MKRISTILTLAMAACLPAAVNAQKNVDRAMKNFESNVEKNGIWRVNNSTDASDSQAYYVETSFSLPKKSSSKIEAIKSAIYEDKDDAYHVFIRKAGHDDKYATLRVNFGDDGTKTAYFGANSDHNYMVLLFRDRTDSLHRYCYALEWYEEGNKLKGSLHRIYGKDPEKFGGSGVKKKSKKRTVTLSDNVYVNGKKLTDEERKELQEKLGGNWPLGENFMGGFSDSMKDLGKTIKKMTTTTHIDSDGTVTVTSSDGDNVQTYTSGSNGITTTETEDMDGIDVLQKFSNLRAAYLTSVREQAGTTVLTGLANSVCSLMKEGSQKLSDAEKKLIKTGLNEMQGLTKDPYIGGLLGIAEGYLKK